jgi:4-hydroxythreonine-4-phosphate dehydrogenase
LPPKRRRPAIRARPRELPLIALTAGEPAGIGPDLCVALSRRRMAVRVVIVADRGLLEARARALRLKLKLEDFPGRGRVTGRSVGMMVRHVPLAAPAVAGRLDPANAAYVLRTLEVAADGCRDGEYDAMVTAPVQKSVINEAGIAFTGHTEFLAERLRAPHVVMMMVGGGMRVALATTHVPLREVASRITGDSLERTLTVLKHDLSARFAIRHPRIAVAGLNPHAGEGGFLGREEIEVIGPVIARLRRRAFDLTGPVPADTLFTPQRLKRFDCVLAMYHDQGLPVLKHASFGAGVNVTLGLPIIRTSVDHGTALELAGRGGADAGSLLEAIALAGRLAGGMRRRRP